jgi:epoxyqueuosine reductase
MERALAQRAGLGWIGKNTMLLNRKAGSFFFLGEIFTSAPLPVDQPYEADHCGSCSACLDLCPTNAFPSPHVLDARRCISYLTIELKGSIPEELRALMGNRVFGCDDCQLVCPWNRFSKPTKEDDFQPRHQLDNSELATLFLWSEEEFLTRTEGSAIRRTGYQGWLRNLAVGLGNAPSTIPVIEALKARADHPSELVREHVQWALQRHGL